MDHILVAVDGSPGANKAAEFGAKLALATGARVTLVHVYDAPSAAAMGLRHLSEEELARTREGLAAGSLAAARAAMGEVGERAEAHLAMGHPAEEICIYAAEVHPDLLVVGSRGLSDLKGFVLGSVSERVVRHASCPVTVVR